MHKKLFILAIFLLTIGIIGTVFTAKAYFTNIEQQDTQKIQSDSIQVIKLNSSYGAFEIVEGTSDEIIIKTSQSNKAMKPKVEINGDTLLIKTSHKNQFQLGINFRYSEDKMYVYLPKKEFKKIIVDNSVGSIKVANIQAKNLVLSSKTGSIQMKDVDVLKTVARSQVGSIKVFGETKNLVLSSEAGSIKVDTDSLQHPGSISSSVGSIKVFTDKKPENYMITANTKIGSTSIFGEDTNTYTNGNSQHTLKLETKTGSIKVE